MIAPFIRLAIPVAVFALLTPTLSGQPRPTAYLGPVNVSAASGMPSNTAILGHPMLSQPGYHYRPIQPFAPSMINLPPSPYALNTTGYYPNGYYGPGVGGALAGYGATLQGFSSTVQAAGQYSQDIQQARILREQSRQMALDTQRKALQYEWWYENQMLQSNRRLRDAERELAIDRARKDPPQSEILSGLTLNVLLKTILASPTPDKGPYLSLEPETVRGLNLTDGSGKGSLAMAKDEGKIEWTEVLEGRDYDDIRQRFEKNFQKATRSTHYGEMPDRMTLMELREDHKSMVERLDGQVAKLSPSGWIDSRKVLNKLKDTIKGLSDPRLVKSLNNRSRLSLRTVSDLVSYCQKNGLEFGPAAAGGDTAAYQAAYYAVRAYERGLVQLAGR